MALKTTYQNDKFEGVRKYDLFTNSDGTISLVDRTIYQPEGDIFNADDINATNRQINKNESDINVNKNDIKANKNDIFINKNDIIVNKNSVNALLTEINRIKSLRKVNVPIGSWSAGVPCTQTVSISGLTSSDSVILDVDMSDNPSAEVTKARKKSFDCINRSYSGNGTLTLRCNITRPQVTFTMLVKGV